MHVRIVRIYGTTQKTEILLGPNRVAGMCPLVCHQAIVRLRTVGGRVREDVSNCVSLFEMTNEINFNILGKLTRSILP